MCAACCSGYRVEWSLEKLSSFRLAYIEGRAFRKTPIGRIHTEQAKHRILHAGGERSQMRWSLLSYQKDPW